MTKLKFFDLLLLPFYSLVIVSGQLAKTMISVIRFFFQLSLKLYAICDKRLIFTLNAIDVFVSTNQDNDKGNAKSSGDDK